MDGCVFCGKEETLGHTLWNCSMATEVWKELGIKFPSRISSQRDSIYIMWLTKEYAKEID